MHINSETKVTIPAPDSHTTYVVGYNLLDNLHTLEAIKELRATKFLILSDEIIFKHYGNRVTASLSNLGKPLLPSVIPSGEKYKTISIATNAIDPFFQSGLDRKAVLIALGGGVITDMGGFIASILLRGIRAVYLPTTLLAQVDAAIGGKTGVDYWLPNTPSGTGSKMYKNMIGTITQPAVVVCDVDALSSLPPREIRSGLGEMVKYLVGWKKPSFEQLNNIKYEISSQLEQLSQTIVMCQQIKLEVVKKDPLDETGIREQLNLGHTFAHALESVICSDISHGEAVAIGIIACAKVSLAMGLCNKSVCDQVEKTILDLHLQTWIQNVRKEQLILAMRMDKKGGTFVLLEDIGKIKTRVLVPRELIMKALEEIIL